MDTTQLHTAIVAAISEYGTAQNNAGRRGGLGSVSKPDLDRVSTAYHNLVGLVGQLRGQAVSAEADPDRHMDVVLLRQSINGMADRHAHAQGDFMMYAALAHAYPAGQSAARAEHAKRARDRRRKALGRLTAALASFATKGA